MCGILKITKINKIINAIELFKEILNECNNGDYVDRTLVKEQNKNKISGHSELGRRQYHRLLRSCFGQIRKKKVFIYDSINVRRIINENKASLKKFEERVKGQYLYFVLHIGSNYWIVASHKNGKFEIFDSLYEKI